MGRGVLRIEATRTGLRGGEGWWGRAFAEKEIPLLASVALCLCCALCCANE
jgi:hypothetical protein